MYIGVDLSIKSVGIAKIDRNNNLAILLDGNTGLSLKSSFIEILTVAENIATYIPNGVLLFDATQYRFKARAKQQEQLHTLIGAVAAYSDSHTVHRVEPKEIRKVLGLKSNTHKSLVWNYLNEKVYSQIPDNVSEHVLDAIVLADVYKRYSSELGVW